jgi:ferredoxin
MEGQNLECCPGPGIVHNLDYYFRILKRSKKQNHCSSQSFKRLPFSSNLLGVTLSFLIHCYFDSAALCLHPIIHTTDEIMTGTQMPSSRIACFAVIFLSLAATWTSAFTASPLFAATKSCKSSSSTPSLVRYAVQSGEKTKGYEPKWTKKKTLAEEQGSISDIGFQNVGLKGTIPVVFKQGNDTRTSMAWTGQPIRDVASQAGQYIKYGCGKGECGTCECMVNGKWIRPCIATVPSTAAGEELVVQVKATMAKSTSSGTFFSIRSFLMGFWNNILGMIGFVKTRRAARKNWEERKAYEDLVLQKALEKKMQRGTQ